MSSAEELQVPRAPAALQVAPEAAAGLKLDVTNAVKPQPTSKPKTTTAVPQSATSVPAHGSGTNGTVSSGAPSTAAAPSKATPGAATAAKPSSTVKAPTKSSTAKAATKSTPAVAKPSSSTVESSSPGGSKPVVAKLAATAAEIPPSEKSSPVKKVSSAKKASPETASSSVPTSVAISPSSTRPSTATSLATNESSSTSATSPSWRKQMEITMNQLEISRMERAQLQSDLANFKLMAGDLHDAKSNLSSELCRRLAAQKENLVMVQQLQAELATLRSTYNEKQEENLQLTEKMQSLLMDSETGGTLKEENEMLWKRIEAMMQLEASKPSQEEEDLKSKVTGLETRIAQCYKTRFGASDQTTIKPAEELLQEIFDADEKLKRELEIQLQSTKLLHDDRAEELKAKDNFINEQQIELERTKVELGKAVSEIKSFSSDTVNAVKQEFALKLATAEENLSAETKKAESSIHRLASAKIELETKTQEIAKFREEIRVLKEAALTAAATSPAAASATASPAKKTITVKPATSSPVRKASSNTNSAASAARISELETYVEEMKKRMEESEAKLIDLEKQRDSLTDDLELQKRAFDAEKDKLEKSMEHLMSKKNEVGDELMDPNVYSHPLWTTSLPKDFKEQTEVLRKREDHLQKVLRQKNNELNLANGRAHNFELELCNLQEHCKVVDEGWRQEYKSHDERFTKAEEHADRLTKQIEILKDKLTQETNLRKAAEFKILQRKQQQLSIKQEEPVSPGRESIIGGGSSSGRSPRSIQSTATLKQLSSPRRQGQSAPATASGSVNRTGSQRPLQQQDSTSDILLTQSWVGKSKSMLLGVPPPAIYGFAVAATMILFISYCLRDLTF